MREVAGKDWFDLSPEQRRERAMREFKLEILPQLADFEVTQHVFEKLIEEKTIRSAVCDALSEGARATGKAKCGRQLARRCF